MPPTGPSHSLSLNTAQTLAVLKQGLAARPSRSDKQTLLDVVRQIGLLQLDTIHVVARSHYLVMLSRVGLYDPAELDALLYPDRCLFEQWAHAACLIPTEHYRYFAPVIHARRGRRYRWLQRLSENPDAVLAEVLNRIAAEGPLRSVDFQDTRDRRGTWWDWKPAKVALDILFDDGYLMIDRRVNFQRYYDLAERVLPAAAEPPTHTAEDYRRWATLQSVERLGVATIAHIADYYRQPRSQVGPAVEALVTEGTLVPVQVEGWQKTAYLAAADLPLIDQIESGRHRPALTTFLSPFDNLIWDRARVQDLFGFHYRIEVYTSVANQGRKYGYYVMPILRDGRLIGRIDPKADRRSKTLIVHAAYLEAGVEPDDDLAADIRGALHEFARFHGCNSIHVERCEPAVLKELL